MVNNQFVNIIDLVKYLDQVYPHELAWDEDLPRIGFILGDKFQKLNNVLLTLDINEEVIEEAIDNNVNLIIAHHPLIFKPIYKIDYNTVGGRIIKKLIENNISVYTMHTNFDVGIGGIGDYLAKTLGLKNIGGDNLKDSYLRYGDIEEMSFQELIKRVISKFKLNGVKYVGDKTKLVKRVGIFGGSGGNDGAVKDALNLNLDVYISSEFKLSAAQFANYNNLSIIEVNHGVEKLALGHLKNKLIKLVVGEIIVSALETDPFEYEN